MIAINKPCLILLLCLQLFGISLAYAEDLATQQTLTTRSGDELAFDVFRDPAQPTQLRILWIAPSFGDNTRHQQIAEALAKLSAEVWLIDLADALFLTRNATTLREIPADTVANIINALALQKPVNTELLVISNSYGAIPALRGIHAWQAQPNKQGRLIGAVLFSPSFFSQVPELGTAPTFIDELAATNIPIYIFQAAHNGNRWHLPAVLAELKHATVYSEILKDAVSVFYKKDISAGSLAAVEKAPQMILRAARLLRQQPMPNSALPVEIKPTVTRSGINNRLRNYHGTVQATPIKLRDISGQQFDIQDYRGKVTLVNFWATWCRPCVEEIPSLNRLKTAMQGKPFQLISVNYAEAPEVIRSFLSMVNVDFPVLVDPGGQLAGQWKVVAFPSTFVIGPDGKIHYGVNAGIHWDTEEVIRQLNQLLPKPSPGSTK
jgi:peroxiredoxin